MFSQQFLNTSFTAICETDKELWFGTENQGIIVYDKKSQTTRNLSYSNGTGLVSDNITHLYIAKNRTIIAGFKDNGIMAADSTGSHWRIINFHSRNLDAVYEDKQGDLWLTAIDFGTTRLDTKTLKTKYYRTYPG